MIFFHFIIIILLPFEMQPSVYHAWNSKEFFILHTASQNFLMSYLSVINPDPHYELLTTCRLWAFLKRHERLSDTAVRYSPYILLLSWKTKDCSQFVDWCFIHFFFYISIFHFKYIVMGTNVLPAVRHPAMSMSEFNIPSLSQQGQCQGDMVIEVSEHWNERILDYSWRPTIRMTESWRIKKSILVWEKDLIIRCCLSCLNNLSPASFK